MGKFEPEFMMKKIFFLTFIIACWMWSGQNLCYSETVDLKNGASFEGDIIELTDNYVIINTGKGKTFKLSFDTIEESCLSHLRSLPKRTKPPIDASIVTLHKKSIWASHDGLYSSVNLGIMLHVPTGFTGTETSEPPQYYLYFENSGSFLSIYKNEANVELVNWELDQVGAEGFKNLIPQAINTRFGLKPGDLHFTDRGKTNFRGFQAYTADLNASNMAGQLTVFRKDNAIFIIFYAAIKDDNSDNTVKVIQDSIDSLEFTDENANNDLVIPDFLKNPEDLKALDLDNLASVEELTVDWNNWLGNPPGNSSIQNLKSKQGFSILGEPCDGLLQKAEGKHRVALRCQNIKNANFKDKFIEKAVALWGKPVSEEVRPTQSSMYDYRAQWIFVNTTIFIKYAKMMNNPALMDQLSIFVGSDEAIKSLK